MTSIESSLNSGLDGINAQIRNINSGVQGATNSITNLFGSSGGNVNVPAFSLPEVQGKLKFSLPNGFQTTLANLKNTVPDLEDAQNALGAVISKPFDEFSISLNESIKKAYFSDLKLPVPAKAAGASFCGEIQPEWILKLAGNIRTGFTISIWILVAIGILIILGNGYMIYLDHKRFNRQLEKLNAWVTPLKKLGPEFSEVNIDDTNSVDVLTAVCNPLAWMIYQKFGTKLNNQWSRKRFRWFLDYTIYHPSFFFLFVGIFGLVLVHLQIFILEKAKQSALSAANSQLEATNSMINNAIQRMVSQSVDPYVSAANQKISDVEVSTNQILFGWINNTLNIINGTSATFNSGFNAVLGQTFGNVPVLKDVISKFVQCMIGSTFDSIIGIGETLRMSLYLDFPRVDSSIGNIDSSSLADVPLLAERLAVKLESGTSGGQKSPNNSYVFQKEMDRMVNYYKSILETQNLAFYICTGFGVTGWILGILGVTFLKF